ncbi:S66 family peptidase [Bacillus sp. 2205SS5-2]|uniref:S66 family peptidase n=1 Tax=Bacillus sp. 2205SS5-2 TaxID=3109031 RepID=UPI00300453F1
MPDKLQLGDTIGICSPASGVAALCPRRFQRGIDHIKELGFQVKVATNALKRTDYMAGSIQDRVDDLHELFTDKGVKAIITAIGGYSSHQLLEQLDFNLIQQNPKILLGYSDITSLHLAILKKANLVTYLGPSVLVQFGEFDGLLPFTKKYFFDLLVEGDEVNYESSDACIYETLMWDEDDDRKRKTVSHTGMKVVKSGQAKGSIVAANLSTLLLLAGTRYFPDMDGVLLCLEDDEEESPAFLDRFFTQLRQMGVYHQIAGLIIGRFHKQVGFKDGQLESLLLRVTDGHVFPIIVGADFGHTDPMYILPNGIKAELNAEQSISFRLLEKAVK